LQNLGAWEIIGTLIFGILAVAGVLVIVSSWVVRQATKDKE